MSRKTDSDAEEREHLLGVGDDTLRKSSSSRFQVSLTANGGEDSGTEELQDHQGIRKNKSVSEPPPPIRSIQERKASSTGRFVVNGGSESHSDGKDESTPEDDEAPVMGMRRGVHFSVGDKNDENPDHKMTTHEEREGQHTFNLKSWRNMKTIEHPPIIDFYRDSIDVVDVNRPSMAQLIHGQKTINEEILEIDEFRAQAYDMIDQGGPPPKPEKIEKLAPPPSAPRTKFGWVEGVFVRCILNIFGVMLYLRISWVTGQAGVLLGIVIVLLASMVTTITAISTCAICTNGEVKGGGAYFLISRSLGPEFGGSIGLIFCVANGVAASMYVVGFAETIRDMLVEISYSSNETKTFLVEHFGPIEDGLPNFVRLIGIASCLLLLAIVFIGTSFESKMQMGLLVILLSSILDYFAGVLFRPISDHMHVRGATTFSWNTLMANLMPKFRNETFFSVFSVYFPAATGIMAGANISGDLADPQGAIPLGTLLAILFTTIIYLVVVIFTGITNVRDADGLLAPLFDAAGEFIAPNCTQSAEGCRYGLMNYYQVVEMGSMWGPLITAGIFAATLSSALASLVSAPKVFQAVCKDRLFPKIDFFAKGYGKDDEPRRAYALVGILALAVIMIGDLNAIAPIISNFFLASYALLNYACFDASFADSPGFRPGFKYYSMWISLAGSILCICVMFLVSWATALLTFFFFAILFLYLLHRKPDVNWGSSTQAHSYKNALSSMVKLVNTEEHVKNYRPQLLVLTGNPAARPSLVDFVENITKGTSLMVCGYVVPYAPCDRVYSVLRKLDRQLNDWLKKKKVKAFYTSIASPSLRDGVRSLYQTAGLGRLRPNIVILGFKANWASKIDSMSQKIHEINDYFGVIQDAFDCHMGVGVLRNPGFGLDFSENMKILNPPKFEEKDGKKKEKENNNGKDSFSKLIDAETPRSPSATAFDTHRSESDVKINIDIDPKSDDPCDQEHEEIVDHPDDTNSSGSFAENFPFDFDLDDSEDDVEQRDSDDEHEQLNEQQNRAHRTKDDVERGEQTLREVRNTLSMRRRGSRRATVEQKALLSSISRFNRKVRRGVIDVWWLYDDGGLTLLVPHLLTIPKSYLEGAKLRVFSISTSSRTMEAEQRGMVALLTKFRIDFSDVSVIADVGRKPKAETIAAWERLITPFVVPDGDENSEGMITESELSSQREKTCRQLRIGELLQEHSKEADLVVMTLPVPRKGLVSAPLYLSWLDIMTRGLPPTLMIRGNQQSVLTFYS
ncbi:unnamed protein product, partial [Mesorhabditis belari]|uniref:Uncharacterized protein n=1 Tax=Mesorhabditis belari TaxID=2138241 RepID=A0AAF3J725_9BILA